MTGHHFAKRGDQCSVELDRDQPPAARRKRDGERAGASSDLEHVGVCVGSRRIGDRVAQNGVDEKVLAEAVLKRDPVPPQQARELPRVGRIDHGVISSFETA